MKRFLSFLGIVAVLPFLISRRSRVFRRVWIDVKPEELFPFVNDLRNWSLWTEWSRREPITERHEGPEVGTGAMQFWETPRMEGLTTILSSVPDQRVSYSLQMQEGRYNMEGAISLEAVGTGTLVTWACWWLGGENPYTRYFDLALRFGIGRDFAAGLQNLKELVEKSAPTDFP